MSMKGKGVKERKGGGESEQKREKKEKVVKKRKANEIKKVVYKRERERGGGIYIYIQSKKSSLILFSIHLSLLSKRFINTKSERKKLKK